MTATTNVGKAPATPDGGPERTIAIGHGALLRAAQKSIEENSVTVDIAGLGSVRLPALDTLAWIGGLATLAAFGFLDWPVVAVIGVGHVLSHQNHMRLLQDFGEALQQV